MRLASTKLQIPSEPDPADTQSIVMLSLASSSLAFSAPSTLARGSVAAGSRARPVFANENEMEPEGGWGVDNLMEMMDTADEVRAHAHS